MKNYYFLYLIFLLFSNTILSQGIQRFNLDTISEKEIVGKKGTVIYFLKKDLDINSSSELILELYENYQNDFSLDKITESLNFSFLSKSGKEISLKKDKKLDVFFPKNNLKYQDHKVFHSKTESKNVKWFIANHFYDEVIIELGGGISKTILMHKDIISKKIKSKNRDFLTKEEYYKKYPVLPNDNYNFFIPKNLKNIFIPNFIKVEESISFNIKKKGNKYFQPQFFIYYENLKMYDEIVKLPDESLNIENIPIFENTYLIAIKEDFDMDKKKSIYYSNKIKLNKSLNNKLLNLNLKKTSKQDLKTLFE